MFRKWLTALLLSLLIFFSFFASSVRAVTVVIEPPTLLNIDGIPVTEAIPRTTNRTPTFVGGCNFPFANMDYEMRQPSILGTGKADSRGIWRWIVPQQLSYGIHTLYVTATDPNDSTNTETSIYRIEVARSGITIVRLGLTWLLGLVILVVAAFIGYRRIKKRYEA